MTLVKDNLRRLYEQSRLDWSALLRESASAASMLNKCGFAPVSETKDAACITASPSAIAQHP
jgi:arsenate reductase-like glutaredoxin family protein